MFLMVLKSAGVRITSCPQSPHCSPPRGQSRGQGASLPTHTPTVCWISQEGLGLLNTRVTVGWGGRQGLGLSALVFSGM